MTKERMRRLREKRREQGIKAREVFLTDEEFKLFKSWLKKLRTDEQEKIHSRNVCGPDEQS